MRVLPAIAAAQALGFTAAVYISINDQSSIISASNLIVAGMMDYYGGNESGGTPGMFNPPYYWWEAGVAWNALIDYGYYTRNNTYDDLIKTSILFQSGKYWNFMTYNQTSVEGNDDQGFWGVTAMTAAEKNFTSPGKNWPTWLYFAQATFNTMASRWDTEFCGGGLRWQIYTWNSGWNYKNMVSNGCLFHLAARLARFTGNQSFVAWADRVWDWANAIKLIAPSPGSTDDLRVYDGTSISDNCTKIFPYEWTYDQGLLLSGCAYLYNFTNDQKWLDRANRLWKRGTVFFKDKIMYEAGCQLLNGTNVCTNDMRCFKGIFSRFLGLTMLMAPQTKDWIWDYITTSAEAAAASCSGGYDQHTCGLDWTIQKWDNLYGLGEQICALDIFNTLQIFTRPMIYTAKDLPEIYPVIEQPKNNTSYNSTNNLTGQVPQTGPVYGFSDAGLNSSTVTARQLDLGTSDKAGAGVITAVVVLFLMGTSAWLVF